MHVLLLLCLRVYFVSACLAFSSLWESWRLSWGPLEALWALFVGLRVALGLSFDVFGVFLLVILLLLHPFRSLRRFIYKKRGGVWGEGCHIESGKGLADLENVNISCVL